ncbi:hypothetical protein, partial, partial [Parasitella parasitica]
FPDDKSKVIYAITNMGGIALKYFQPYLTNLDTNINLPEVITNYQVFKKTVIEAFGDSNPAVNAETMLRNLKHVGPVSIYATEFRQISMDLTWNDSTLMAQFKLQLKDFIVRELARRPECHTLDELIKASIEIENVFTSTRQPRTQTKYTSTSNHPNFNRERGEPMDVSS